MSHPIQRLSEQAARQLTQIAQDVLRGPDMEQVRGHLMDAAHVLQRGAVPVYCTPTEYDGRIVYEHTSEPIPNADGFMLYAPAPDHFCDAAKMVPAPAEAKALARLLFSAWQTTEHAESDGEQKASWDELSASYKDAWMVVASALPTPAEVPMPGSDVAGYVARWGGNCRDCADENGVCPNTGLPCGGARKAIEHVIRALQYGVEHGYIASPINAASDAAGYARDADQLATAVVRAVAELPDRDSPEGWPAAMLVTSDELRGIVRATLRGGVK